jgi:hypothetical protein
MLIKDPCVIDDRLILEACKSHEGSFGNSEENKKGLYSSIKVLIFSYKNIIKIQNLMGLENLETLRLDNNLIENIENLDHLKNLRFLDLSFNCIKNVENLDSLTNLTELSMYNNCIENVSFASLKSLKNLKILSLSSNKIVDLMELIKALKPIKSLEVLSIRGNPFTSDDEYRQYILANLTQLKYLDYIYIDDAMRSMSDDFKYQVDFNYIGEGKEPVKKEEGFDDSGEVSRELRKLNLTNYDKYLLSGNDDLNNLLQIKTAFEESIQKFNENVKNLIDNIRYKLQEVTVEKNGITHKYGLAYKKMVNENEEESQKLINSYFHSKKRLIRYIEETNNSDKKAQIEILLVHIKTLDSSLIDREMNLKNCLKRAHSLMEANYKSIYNTIENIMVGDTGIKAVEDYINEYFSKFQDEAQIEAERLEQYFYSNGSQNSFSRDDLQPNNVSGENNPWTDAQMNLLENKDELKNTINSIKEFVDNRHRANESFIRKELLFDKQNYLKEIQRSLKELNRKNINNIIEFITTENNFWNDQNSKLN